MVSADTVRTVVGILGNCIALGLFLSPLPTFVRIVKKKSVEQFSPFPYLATLLNCLLWVVYGLPMVHPHSMLVITINGSGTAIELCFVLLFIFYAQGSKRFRVLMMLLAELAFTGAVALLVLTLAHTHHRRSMVAGVICVIFGTLMYASPLAIMKLVIETKSVEFLPLSISLASFFNGICWTAYALIRFDPYILVPNGLGVLFAVAQLVLHIVYRNCTRKQMEARKPKAEVGLAQVVVLGDNVRIGSAPSIGPN